MKIIQLCAIDQTVKIFLKALVKQMMSQGFEVICVCSLGPYTEELKEEGLNIINIPIERRISLCSNLKSIYKLYKLFKAEKPDVVHVHTPIAAILGRIAAKAARVPVVIYTAHGFYFHENMSPVKYKLYYCSEKFTARFFTDYIFTQSIEDAQTAIKNNFMNEDRILCIGNGVDVFGKFNPQNTNGDEIETLNEGFGLTAEDTVITFIGRLIREKGILELLEAFSDIKKDNVKLLIVGDVDQGCRDHDTKKLVHEKYKDNKNIIFTGFRKDIHNILYRTDIFCLPSYREGMPRTIIEAMSMECAVIATDIRGCREEVADRQTGYIVKVHSSAELRDSLKALINNKELLNIMKQEGRKRAVKLYNETDVIDRQIKLLHESLKTVKRDKSMLLRR